MTCKIFLKFNSFGLSLFYFINLLVRIPSSELTFVTVFHYFICVRYFCVPSTFCDASKHDIRWLLNSSELYFLPIFTFIIFTCNFTIFTFLFTFLFYTHTLTRTQFINFIVSRHISHISFLLPVLVFIVAIPIILPMFSRVVFPIFFKRQKV